MAAVVANKVKRNRSSRLRSLNDESLQLEIDQGGIGAAAGQAERGQGQTLSRQEREARAKKLQEEKERIHKNMEYYRKVFHYTYLLAKCSFYI